MTDFQKIDWKLYNKPPFYQQWLCRDDTLKLATFGDKGLSNLDDQILALKDQWDLGNIKGHFLDRIGKLLNEKRNGNIDDNYKMILKLRTLLNTSDSSVNNVIKVIKFIFSSEVVHIVPNYPAGISILHDGETHLKNFNTILTEVVPAGVAYDTKELFDLFENIMPLSDSANIVVIINDMDRFNNQIKYNGAIKYDGHTTNEKIVVYNKYDGNTKYNGQVKFNGLRKDIPVHIPRPPFRYSSRTTDVLQDISVRLSNFLDTVSSSDVFGVITITKNFDEIILSGDNFGNIAITKDIEDTVGLSDDFSIGIRYHHKYDGSRKYDGSIRYDSMVLKAIAA